MIYGITDITTYVLGTIFIVLLPGPNSLYVLAVASKRGVRAGYQGACGIFVGDAVLMLLSATGVASVLQASPGLFLVLKYIGAAYLAWLGIGLLRAAWTMWETRGRTPDADTRIDTSRPFHAALVISLMNPKAIMFFVSFFIQFVDPGYAYPALSFAILGIVCQIISALYLTALIFGGAHLAQQFCRRRRLAAGATGGIGAVFIGFGARLADSALN